jgi:NAD(P)-dependent dehydrogenase (short-subunit alcohol dehydrogenase family)
MQGKTVLVTGATNGIGKVAALELARLGAQVIVVGRNAEKTRATVDEIQSATQNPNVKSALADLSLMSSTRALADQIKRDYNRIDVLLNNAGGIFYERQVTSEGLEMTFALNHMSYFLLTHLLMDMLKASAPARVVNVSSNAHQLARKFNIDDLQSERGYSGFAAYGQSKLANVLFSNELARRLKPHNIVSNALHPGAVATGFGTGQKGGGGWFAGTITNLILRFGLSPEQGAKTSLHLATSPQVEGVTGKYFSNSRETAPSAAARDEAMQRRLWEASEHIATPALA